MSRAGDQSSSSPKQGCHPWYQLPAAALGQRGHRVAPLEPPSSARLGDKSGAEQSAAAPCKVQGSVSEAEAGGRLPKGPLELVGDTAMLFEEYLLQGECSPFALEQVLVLGTGTGEIRMTLHPAGGTYFGSRQRGVPADGWVGMRWRGE